MTTSAVSGLGIRRGSGGFTLMEVMITIAIVAIVAAIALPSFRDTLMVSNTKALSGEVATALNLARNEAVKRGVPITVAGSGTDWSGGWTVQNGADVLQSYPQVAIGYAVSSTVQTVTFNPTGFLSSAVDITINVCATADSTRSRQITIRPAGVIRTIRKNVTCP